MTLHGRDVAVSDVHMDSRAVTPGSLYVAIAGSRADGHDYISGAIDHGAVAVAVERSPSIDVPYLKVADTRAALGWLASAVHREPASDLSLIGITGTNGKTTVAHMMAAMALGTDREMAVIGTVSANLDNINASPRTTPEASNLQRMLRQLADDSPITDVAIEVSSHAMEMGRVNGTAFDIVAFTNLSQDHLDYHHTMEDYFAAKAKLFRSHWAPRAVIWTDDDWGNRLAEESEIPVTTVGSRRDCDVRVTYGGDMPGGSTFTLRIGDATYSVKTALAGRFNVSNAAIAITCAHLQGWDLERSVAALETMRPIPGRYNCIDNDRGLWVVVDYAHTPDAVETVIGETRALVSGKIIAIAGAGGDRDQEKRPKMGRALSTADVPIITNDNPRSEDPRLIIEQILEGMGNEADVLVQPDRRLAIRAGIATAEPGDAVLILGKGHESAQEYADGTVEFDDAAVTREELALLEGDSP
ncbi:MAG: UDP-N-acetylmuramoyl-L-alanyl-D-glutamate--2,6-diaminopimelate ligase [bacterium]|nr:UDP-N-acetylmuramoyl-L-alanyl-D-glutamate--2,6-diaminopimelate ligase [bacterium]